MMIKKDANNGLQALADVGLPNGKTDLVELEQFTFDKFYKIYHTICPRPFQWYMSLLLLSLFILSSFLALPWWCHLDVGP